MVARRIVATAARARRRGGVGSHRGARIGRNARSVAYADATCMFCAISLPNSLTSRPRIERPSDRMASRRHSASRSMSPVDSQCSADVCAACVMCLPKLPTLCLVNTGCSARLRGAHSLLGRTKRLSPETFRISWWIRHRSVSPSVRPNTSRTPLGELTSTRAGARNLGQRYEARHRSAGLAQQRQSGVQRPRRRQHLSNRQRILRRQRKRADVEPVDRRGHGTKNYDLPARMQAFGGLALSA